MKQLKIAECILNKLNMCDCCIFKVNDLEVFLGYVAENV